MKPTYLDADQAFRRYKERLIADSKRYGLTSLRDPEAIQRRHFDESLAILAAMDELGVIASPAIDIGSGAGFPGIPIKIARPDLRITLLEATGKKARFLEELIADLGLPGVSIVNERAETLAHDPGHREAYALAMARAVAPLRVLLELSLPFLRVGGHLAAVKGSGAEREVREAAHSLEILGGEVVAMRKVDVPGPGPEPTLVVVRKVQATPGRYPRRPGVPSKRPL